MSRVRYAAAALAAMTTGVAALFLTLVPAQAASPNPSVATQPAAEVVDTTTVSDGTATFEVSPTTDLAATGATIKVVGAEFSDTAEYGLTIAVCAAGSTDLDNCVGGPVPEGNTTTAWAYIGANGPPVTGGVRTDWKSGGFDVTLTLPSVVEGSLNCVTSKCSLYAVSNPGDKVKINPVPLTFKAPPSSSSSAPSTPGTAVAQSVGTPSIVPGGTQTVLFSGFRAGEQVNLTLFSAPVTLSPVTADGTGVANVSFVVPADSEVGTHRLEAIGQQSGTTGVATFQVIAPPVSSSPTPTPSPSPSPSPTPSPTSSSVVASSSAPASSSAVTSSSAAGGTVDDSGSSLWWLWLIIGIVVVAGIITGIVVYRRNQQAQREQEEKDIADAAAQQQAAGATGDPYADAPTVFLPPVPPGPGGPPPGSDPYGLLSGHDHPDSPTLYSGDPAGPTEVIGQGPGRPPYGQPLGQGGPEQGYSPPAGNQPPPAYGGSSSAGPAGGPPTEAMPPVAGDAGPQRPAGPSTGPDGPGTQAWAPDFDDTETGQPGSETPGDGDTGGPTGGTNR